MIDRVGRLAILLAIIGLAGCGGSPPIHYYTLSAEASLDSRLPGKNGRQITIGPVTLPDMVERPQLVLRTSANKVSLVEDHQWAEPLKSDIPRVIAENLARLLGTRQVSVYPQSAGDQAEYRVLVDVQQFESSLGSRAAIDALRAAGKLALFPHRVRNSPCPSASPSSSANRISSTSPVPRRRTAPTCVRSTLKQHF